MSVVHMLEFDEIRVLIASLLPKDVEDGLLVVGEVVPGELRHGMGLNVFALEVLGAELVENWFIVQVFEHPFRILVLINLPQLFILAPVLVMMVLESQKALLVQEQNVLDSSHSKRLGVLSLGLQLLNLSFKVNRC